MCFFILTFHLLTGLSTNTVKRLILRCTFFLLLGSQAQASPLAEALNTAERLDLASHPTWLKLLHYECDSKQSAVLTDSFFLSTNGRGNPSEELTATINAYFSPWTEDINEHAQRPFVI